jgi:hypothetical protein
MNTRRTAMVTIRLTAAELRALRAAAKADDRAVSALIRHRALRQSQT